jgi:TolB-like protein
MSAPEIVKTLNIDAIVEGSVIREGSRVRVNAQLIRGATDEHLWSEAYDRELGQVIALQSEVAQCGNGATRSHGTLRLRGRELDAHC